MLQLVLGWGVNSMGRLKGMLSVPLSSVCGNGTGSIIATQLGSQNASRYPTPRASFCTFFESNVLALDISYRDDLRMFCAWHSGSSIMPDLVRSWAWAQWRRRFLVGTMSVEEADPGCFFGLQVEWEGAYIGLRPRTPDPWAAHCYDEVDNFPLKPSVKGLFCRACFFQFENECLWL